MISVIIPVYNEEKTIKNTLDNLIASVGMEMIVFDGGSPDQTHETIRR